MSWFKSDFSKSDWEEHVEQQLNLEQKEQLVHVEWLSQFPLKCLQLLLQRGIYNKARKKNTWTENYSLEKINKEIFKWNSYNISISKILIKSENYNKTNGKLARQDVWERNHKRNKKIMTQNFVDYKRFLFFVLCSAIERKLINRKFHWLLKQ